MKDPFLHLDKWNVKDVPFGECPWVYHLLKNDIVVYVGTTINGITRIKNHFHNEEKKFDSFRYIECPNQNIAKGLEGRHIWLYNPIYNYGGAWHPLYEPATYFNKINWLHNITEKQYLKTIPFKIKAGYRYWHKKYKFAPGSKMREVWENKSVFQPPDYTNYYKTTTKPTLSAPTI